MAGKRIIDGKRAIAKSDLEYLGIEAEVREKRKLEQRIEELQQKIKEKRNSYRLYETDVEKVYYDHRKRQEYASKAEGKPLELKDIYDDERYDYLQKLLGHENSPRHTAKGKIGWNYDENDYGPVLSLPKGAFNLLASPHPPVIPASVRELLEDIIIYHHYTWSISGNKFRLEDYRTNDETRTTDKTGDRNKGCGMNFHFDLVWPKGDGLRYDIFDVDSFPAILEKTQTIRHLGDWAYGSPDRAYKTKSGLAVLRFHFRAD